MADQRTVKQHTVPRSYLERFADERIQVMRVPLPSGPGHRQSINSATVENDFYTVELPDGTPSDIYEKAWSEIEGAALPAFKAVLDDNIWPLRPELKHALAEWAALQVLRTPAMRRGMDDSENALARLVVGAGGKEALRGDMEMTFGRSVSDDELDAMWHDFTRPEGAGLKTSPGRHIEHILALLPGTTKMFSKRQWSLIRFKRKRLMTSDHPVSLVPNFETPFLGTGLINAAHIVFALDRRTSAVIHQEYAADVEKIPTANFAKYVNQNIAVHAYRAVYHHPDDDPLRGIELPEPLRPRVTAGNMDHLISETGHRTGPDTQQPDTPNELHR